MILEFSDWIFNIDTDATAQYYFEESSDRCECGFCRNFYATVDMFYPDLRFFLKKFSIDPGIPEMLLPFRSTLYQASYYTFGKILRYGSGPILVNGVTVTVEEGEEPDSILLHIGLMELPWILEEDPSEERTPGTVRDFFTGLNGQSSNTLS